MADNTPKPRVVSNETPADRAAALNRTSLYAEVSARRRYQDAQWGGPEHDDVAETESAFVGYIEEYAAGEGRAAGRPFRDRMIDVAALAVAAIERHDRLAKRA